MTAEKKLIKHLHNEGAEIEREAIKNFVLRMEERYGKKEATMHQAAVCFKILTWINHRSARTAKKPGGLGRK